MALKAIVGEKVAMSQVWVNDKVVPVTVLRVEPARIVQVKTIERDGYTALRCYGGGPTAAASASPRTSAVVNGRHSPGAS